MISRMFPLHLSLKFIFQDPDSSTALSAEISTEECGKTKGCYRHPKDCPEHYCSLILTWEKTKDDLIKFELGGDTEGWVAVGFSHDKKMVS